MLKRVNERRLKKEWLDKLDKIRFTLSPNPSIKSPLTTVHKSMVVVPLHIGDKICTPLGGGQRRDYMSWRRTGSSPAARCGSPAQLEAKQHT